jgi:hypothetical protein
MVVKDEEMRERRMAEEESMGVEGCGLWVVFGVVVRYQMSESGG